MKASVLDVIVARQSEAHTRGVLNMWTVYDRPRDFPDSHVARRFECGGGHTEPVATRDVIKGDLPAIRDALSRCGLVCLSRNDSDEPQIVESWV